MVTQTLDSETSPFNDNNSSGGSSTSSSRSSSSRSSSNSSSNSSSISSSSSSSSTSSSSNNTTGGDDASNTNDEFGDAAAHARAPPAAPASSHPSSVIITCTTSDTSSTATDTATVITTSTTTAITTCAGEDGRNSDYLRHSSQLSSCLSTSSVTSLGGYDAENEVDGADCGGAERNEACTGRAVEEKRAGITGGVDAAVKGLEAVGMDEEEDKDTFDAHRIMNPLSLREEEDDDSSTFNTRLLFFRTHCFVFDFLMTREWFVSRSTTGRMSRSSTANGPVSHQSFKEGS